jgi:hypothetical protein
MAPQAQPEGREALPAFEVDGGEVSPHVLHGPASEAPPVRAGLRWLRAVFSFPAMLTVLLITVVFTMARGGLGDPDIWWHLRNAEYLLNHHQFPRQDLYSFTVAGHLWINHEWLAELPYYLVWRARGLWGIKTLVLGLLEAIFLGLLYLCYKASGNFKGSVVACCSSVFLGVVSFGPRTILFGYAYLIALLIILERFRRQGRAPLWLIPPLFCLWINTHGSWSLGLIVFGVIVAAGLVEGRWGRVEAERWTPSQLRKLVVIGLASVTALFVNPFGYRLVLYPFDLAFRQKVNVSHVAEWMSVDFHDIRGKIALVLLIGLLLSALLRDCRWALAELGLVLFALYCGLTYIRFLFLLGIVAAPALAKILDFLPPYRPEIDKPLLNALFIGVMVTGMARYYPTTPALEHSVAQQYPAEVLSFLSSHAPTGPMLNDYLWGGYLGWNDRNLKVFIDSRVDIFEYSGVLQDYLDLMALKKPQSILDKYQIRYVLFPPDQPLTYVLEHDRGWKVVTKNQVSVLLERVGETATSAAAATVGP